jgi:hypothetical protein
MRRPFEIKLWAAGRKGLELELFLGRERSGSPQAKSWVRRRV